MQDSSAMKNMFILKMLSRHNVYTNTYINIALIRCSNFSWWSCNHIIIPLQLISRSSPLYMIKGNSRRNYIPIRRTIWLLFITYCFRMFDNYFILPLTSFWIISTRISKLKLGIYRLNKTIRIISGQTIRYLSLLNL